MGITGVIRPPPEIRAVADRTASYVAKNGRAFEARILKSEKGKTPKFAFLQPTSPFHAYYEERIQFYEDGGEDDKEEDKKVEDQGKVLAKPLPKETARKKESKQKASAIDPIAKALLEQRAKLRASSEPDGEEAKDNDAKSETPTMVPPLALEFVTIVAPSNLTASQLETMQLVAQFAAMDGKGGPFLHQLSVREWSNPEYSFCQPRHAHFAYFSALVDAYRKILGDWTDGAGVKTDPGISVNVTQALQEAAYRAEYERAMASSKSQEEDGEVVAIDWHDFVVVETIDFAADEAVELGMPPPPPPPLQHQVETQLGVLKEGDAMDESDEEGETIRVVPSYTPRVVGTTIVQDARAIDPITGKSVSVADVPEHLRIQLLDPKWAEERKKFQEKQKDSNLVGGNAIVDNISRFAEARGDYFGKSEQEILKNEKDSKKRLADANRLLREQAYQQAPSVRPSMPGPSADALSEPAAKRMRLDLPPGVAVPPPPGFEFATTLNTQPPPQPTIAIAPTSDHNLSTGDPMADAMFQNTTTTESNEKERLLVPEAEFAASLKSPEVTLQIRIPNDPSQMAWNFYGQILSLTVNVMSKVKDVKSELSRMHLNGMPVNKVQLRDQQSRFLDNKKSLAELNIGPTETLDMIMKIRGGRK